MAVTNARRATPAGAAMDLSDMESSFGEKARALPGEPKGPQESNLFRFQAKQSARSRWAQQRRRRRASGGDRFRPAPGEAVILGSLESGAQIPVDDIVESGFVVL